MVLESICSFSLDTGVVEPASPASASVQGALGTQYVGLTSLTTLLLILATVTLLFLTNLLKATSAEQVFVFAQEVWR